MTSFEERLQENILLKNYSTLGIGGPARFFVDATDLETIEQALQWVTQQHLPLFVLGGGSNVLISDQGFAGLVLHLTLRGIESRSEQGNIIVDVAAGEEWDGFVAYAVDNHWGGVECLSGIPGKIGATPIQNVGAYGQEVKDTIVSVNLYDRYQRSFVTLPNSACQFRYRQSIFKSKAVDRYIVLGVSYRLTPNGKPSINYPELQKYLAERINGTPTLAAVREAVLTIRRQKSMVLNPLDSDSRSVGSFFVNPILSRTDFAALESSLRTDAKLRLKETIPHFPAPENMVKLSAAWLIEQAGFYKGYQYANVGISNKHALAIVNRGAGTAQEVLDLVKKIQHQVQQRFGILLTPEPVFIGFDNY
ncbi:MAG: UDP-N-acetylmuramate dehydrogenase [Acidobacteriota bacterium]